MRNILQIQTTTEHDPESSVHTVHISQAPENGSGKLEIGRSNGKKQGTRKFKHKIRDICSHKKLEVKKKSS